MDYGLARNVQFRSLLKIIYILPTVAYGQLLPLEDTKYEEQVVKGVRDRSVLLACGDVVSPMIVFWSFTRLGSLIPRAVAISNGLDSKVEKSSVVLGDVTLRNSTLEIENLKEAAEGHFMCQVMYEEEGEIKVAYFYIELIVLVPVSKPFLQMNDSAPVEDMPVLMVCTVKEGTPPVEFSWQRYTNRDGMVAITEAVGGLLNLTSTNRTHMGWYTCTAHNEVNSQTSDQMYLDVIYGPDEPVISVEPFAVNQHGFLANEQEEVIMTCLALSNPPSHYIWFYNSSQVHSGQKYVIPRILRTQTGIYTCLAQNLHLNTRTQTAIILTVYYLPQGKPSCVPLPAANFRDLALHCSWQGGFPPVRLQWVKSRKEGNHMATYSNITQIHRGMDIHNGTSYTCLASHPALKKDAICKTTVWVPGGSPSCSAVATKQNEFLMLTCDWAGGEPQVTLWWRDWRDHVLGGLKQSHNIFVMKSNTTLGGKEFTCMAAHPLRAKAAKCHVRLEPPRLVVERSKVSLFEGNGVQLACHLLTAYLGSEVFWYNNKNQVIRSDAKKYRLQKENAWFNLTLQDTEWMKDSGIYRCAAINAVGNASAFVNLQVKKYPTPPNVTISRLMYMRHRTEVELEWQTQGSGNLTGFVVQRREAKKATKKQLDVSWEIVASDIDPDIRDQKLGGLDPAVVYAFRILAVNHRTTGHPSEVKTPGEDSGPYGRNFARRTWQTWRTLCLHKDHSCGNKPGCRSDDGTPLEKGFEDCLARVDNPKRGDYSDSHILSYVNLDSTECLPNTLNKSSYLPCPGIVGVIVQLTWVEPPWGKHVTIPDISDPPFNAYPAVIGAAVAGMIVATITSLLVFQYIIRNRENNPRLHDLLFRMAGAEAREHISTPDDAETAVRPDVEASEQVGEPSTAVAGETLAELSPEDTTGGPEDPAAAPTPEPTAVDDPVNVTITVTATP